MAGEIFTFNGLLWGFCINHFSWCFCLLRQGGYQDCIPSPDAIAELCCAQIAISYPQDCNLTFWETRSHSKVYNTTFGRSCFIVIAYGAFTVIIQKFKFCFCKVGLKNFVGMDHGTFTRFEKWCTYLHWYKILESCLFSSSDLFQLLRMI